MKQETLDKAKSLENEIEEYSRLLCSRNASYNYMLIKITCANASPSAEYYGRMDKELWMKMTDVVKKELVKKRLQLDELSDGEMVAPGEWQPTGKYLTDETVETSDGEQWVVADSDGNARITVKLKTAMVAIFLWMLFCIAIGIIGIVNWVTTVSNVFFALFMLWMMNHERKQIENRKED